ncbi:MAG: S41 family peptidase [Ignavibacterium sp.]|nr:S41 family peptidase [Ignavibacterium sp.]MDW8374781.1 S41 family peptidase [Ignavibacteriales bacterium]
MKNKIISLALLITFIAGFTFIKNGDIYYEVSKNIDVFGKIYKEITFNYVDEINPSEFIKAGIKGMLDKLDPYTVFIDESRKSDIDILTNGKYGGIGVSIGIQNNQVKITEIIEGYPAARQGIKIGDIILEVDGFKVSADNYDEVSPRVKGEPGTPIELKILRYNRKDTLIFKMVREEILLKSLAYYGFYPSNSNNVYLKLNNFNKTAAAEIQSAIKKLRNEKEIKSIILDLRGNPGGLLESAIEVSDKFLNKGLLIVSTRGKDISSEKKYYSSEEPLVKNEKLIILINENSASASEIVAGAIQDHDRGIILGTQSFGKGLVQTITPITNDVSLKITTARYYTPSGRCIQKVDYSKDNKVVKLADKDSVNNFFTDNLRKVYAFGGITPDTIVENIFRNNLIDELLSQGIIYEFVDEYTSDYSLTQFEKDSDANVFNKFVEFVRKNPGKLKLDSSKKISELISTFKSDSTYKRYISDLENIQKKIDESAFQLLKKQEYEITGIIKIELVRRFYDSKKSIEESLKRDNQIKIALDLLNDNEKYNRTLNKE